MRVRIAPGTPKMKKRQRYWLYFILIYFSTHLVRDALQDMGIKVFLSTIFVKQPAYPQISSVLWKIFNTYAIAVTEITLAIICLKDNFFGKTGRLTIIIAIVAFFVWLMYWFFL